jgi:hypothetical protein
MSKTKIITEKTVDDPETIEKTPLTFLELMKGEGKIHISRITPEGRRKRIGTYRKEDFETDPDIVPRNFGGGTYYFQIANERGQIIDNFTFDYDEMAWGEPKGPMSKSPDSDLGPGFVQAPESSPIELMRMMQEQSDKTQERTLTLMTALMSPFMQAFGNRQSEKTKIDELKELLGLVNSTQKPEGSTDKIIDALKLGIELGGKGVNGEAEPEGILQILGKKLINDGMLEQIVTALKGGNKKEQPPILPPKVQQLAVDTEAHEVKPQPNPPAVKPDYYEHPAVKMYGPLAVIYAKTHVPPEHVAGKIFEEIPETPLAESKTLEILNKPDFLEFVCLYQPDLKNYATWVYAVRDNLKALLTAPPEPEAPAGLGGAGPALG